MDSPWNAMLTSWDLRADVILTLALAGGLFSRGWLHLRRSGANRLAAGWRLAVYLGGLAALALALLSAIDVFQSLLFFMHMIQHLLLVMIAPPLLLLANPMPFILWGLPVRARRAVAGLFAPEAAFRQGLRKLTTPRVSWFVFIMTLLGWHDPNAYNASLGNDLLHDVEHLTFFGSGLLYWWHVVGAAPPIHGRIRYGLRIAYLLVTVPINMLLGVSIAFSRGPIYTYYTTVPRLWGISVMNDQTVGGAIMWIPGSMMYLVVTLIFVVRMADEHERKHRLSTGGTLPQADAFRPVTKGRSDARLQEGG